MGERMTGTVLVVGGGGFYGRYLVRDILQNTEAEVIIASRHPPPIFADTGRVRTAVCDLNDLATLERLASASEIVVHCAGPFQPLPLKPLQAAINARVHYIDISEDRTFARRVLELAPPIKAAGIAVLNGLSVAPAMEALFAELIRPRLDGVLSVRTFAAPDTRKHRGHAMFHTMLVGVGRPFQQPRQGQLARVHGWTEPEWVEFPPPVGKRLTYLVLEMADLDVLPQLFGAETVEFKAGTEHLFLNQLLNVAAIIRARIGHPQWEQFTPWVRALSWLTGRIGKDEGGVVFEIGGRSDGARVTYRVAVMADHDGGLIPAVLAGMAVEEILSRRLAHTGVIPVHTWITSVGLIEGLTRRGLKLWWQPPGERQWQTFSLAELRQGQSQ